MIFSMDSLAREGACCNADLRQSLLLIISSSCSCCHSCTKLLYWSVEAQLPDGLFDLFHLSSASRDFHDSSPRGTPTRFGAQEQERLVLPWNKEGSSEATPGWLLAAERALSCLQGHRSPVPWPADAGVPRRGSLSPWSNDQVKGWLTSTATTELKQSSCCKLANQFGCLFKALPLQITGTDLDVPPTSLPAIEEGEVQTPGWDLGLSTNPGR